MLLRSLTAWVVLCSAPIAYSASFESLINPGDLIAAHAELEEGCEACHAPFERTLQTTLCLTCHEDVAIDQASRVRFHGKNEAVLNQECRACHTDHIGRDADVIGLVAATFDHTQTEFELQGLHRLVECGGCHVPEMQFREASQECVGCHESQDKHKGGLGEACADCHNESDWDEVSFEHGLYSDFKLVDAHSQANCAQCHIDQVYESTPETCVECHQLDDVHQGARGSECGSCHSSVDWQSSEFDHNRETGFELMDAHVALSCSGCHLQGMTLVEPPTSCIGCHSAIDVHAGAHGEQCGDCHSQSSWELSFDHSQETDFTLVGAHAVLNCQSCHIENLSAQLPTNCVGCHEESDPHQNTLGDCGSCHGETSWTQSLRFEHEFTEFPLVGMHRIAVCDQCHSSRKFDDAATECAACHDDTHDGVFAEQCQSCHNPGGWEFWDFDHSAQTTFTLSGSHEGLICASCHSKKTGLAQNTAKECVACHLGDDKHRGEFGSECQQCHTMESFADDVRLR